MAVFRTISNPKKFNFCNFPVHFPCLSALKKIQTFLPFQGILRKRHTQSKSHLISRIFGPFRGILSHRPFPAQHPVNPPHFRPFQGIAYLDVSKKNAFILSRNYSVFLRISSVLAQFQGVWGRFWGRGWDEKGRRFCRRIPLLGEILGGWGGRKPGDFFSKNTSKLGNFLGG